MEYWWIPSSHHGNVKSPHFLMIVPSKCPFSLVRELPSHVWWPEGINFGAFGGDLRHSQYQTDLNTSKPLQISLDMNMIQRGLCLQNMVPRTAWFILIFPNFKWWGGRTPTFSQPCPIRIPSIRPGADRNSSEADSAWEKKHRGWNRHRSHPILSM